VVINFTGTNFGCKTIQTHASTSAEKGCKDWAFAQGKWQASGKRDAVCQG
jgi:hypothetical protein